MNDNATVYIVDDDAVVRDALKLLMESVGLQVVAFASAQEYLDQFDADQAGCLIVDVRPPVIIITGHGDVPMAVRAVQAGAVDFLEKPFNNQAMLDSVHHAIEMDAKRRGESSRLQEIEERYHSLTPREKEVLQLVIEGKRNKNIAYDLDISQSTVEVHRSRVMEKMQARTLSDLMRMTMAMDLLKADHPL
jgi:two-component system, LuxR family, response regulator FixJ